MMYNDCVVIPGWGALIANYTPSRMSGNTIIRPSRNITFNQRITHNDGLLATSIARRHSMAYDAACEMIATHVASLKSQLAAGNEVSMGRMGLFKPTAKGKMEFEPFSQDEAFNEFFGLKNIVLNSLDEASTTHVPQAVITGNIWHERMKAAASVAAIVAAGLLFSTPVIIDRSTQTASVTPVEVKTRPAQIIDIKPTAATTARDNRVAVIDNTTGKPQDEEAIESTYNPGLPSDLNGRYLLVINPCHKASQAAKMVKQYAKKGIKTRVVGRGKFHHVVAAQGNSERELRRAKNLLPASCRNAWVCK